ncbi:MAG: helix-turn-helix domain-containing protein [Ruminococcaceae bacterium]|nr:helix-turn-helix domain-containing protein [Oscillospiraceae bacterium]MBE6902569.1 helix-turn-helix domain-containing protein [Oscillospiraceae bacterium]
MAIIEHSRYYENPLFGVSHAHTSCELMYIVEGELDVTVKDTTYHICKNDCVLIKSRQHHMTKVPVDMEYHRYIAMINPWELRKQLVRPDLFAMLTDISKDGIIILRDVPQIKRCFERMTDIFENGANIYGELSAALGLLSVLHEQVRPHREHGTQKAGKKLTDRVRSFIEENYAEGIKISEIARDNFISEGYLSHTFKAETGMSPREYLSHIRCTRAYDLIRHTAMKFTEIAAVTGFCCANDMSRKLHEYYELTPTQIRSGKSE